MKSKEVVVSLLEEPEDSSEPWYEKEMSDAELERRHNCELFDWEVRFGGRLFYHGRQDDLTSGWEKQTKSGDFKEVTSHRGLKALAEAVRIKRKEIWNARRWHENGSIPALRYHGRWYMQSASAAFKYGDSEVPYWELYYETVDRKLSIKLNRIWNERNEKKTTKSEPAQIPSDEPSGSGENPEDVKRTKHGVRIFSNDNKHFFGIGVWKSTKYEGCTTISLMVAGKQCLYTVDKTGMKALRSEISRGEPT